MKKLTLVFLAAFLIAVLSLTFYWNYRTEKKPSSPRRLILMTSRLRLANVELEEQLVFFLARKLGIYEGAFEIIDVVNLDTRDIAGADYILVTLKAPDGKLCQVTLTKQSYPWARWELVQESLTVSELPWSSPSVYIANTKWMEDLGITADEVRQYYTAHPEKVGNAIESAFLDRETGRYTLPPDWWQAPKLESPFRLEINKDKTIDFVSEMKQSNAYDYYWNVDYPSELVGPGYRVYLYKKVKGGR